MVRTYTKNKEYKKLSPLGMQVSKLFRNACKYIENDDSTDNIIYLLTYTIQNLNTLLITYLSKPNKEDMN